MYPMAFFCFFLKIMLYLNQQLLQFCHVMLIPKKGHNRKNSVILTFFLKS